MAGGSEWRRLQITVFSATGPPRGSRAWSSRRESRQEAQRVVQGELQSRRFTNEGGARSRGQPAASAVACT